MSSNTPHKIPYNLIPDAVMHVLSQDGKTISALEGINKRRYPGDESQLEYQNQSLWHKKNDLDVSVAKKLKLDPIIWGPERNTSDLHIATSQEISKLRKKGKLIDWNSARRSGIWRLAQIPDRPITDLKMSISGAPPTHKTEHHINWPTSDENLKQTFLSILTGGRKDNTYKFALARALLDYAKDTNTYTTNIHEVSYRYLASKFLKYYWHQECKFKIRQTFHTKSKPKIIQVLNKVFDNNVPGSFNLLDKSDIQNAEERIIKTVFGHARSKTSLVVPKFQKVMSGQRAVETRVFYDYNDDEKKIYLKSEAFEFFKKNHDVLSRVVLVEWAKYLEKINDRLPKLIAKIDQDNVKRTSLAQYKTLFSKYTDHCFYCCNNLEKNYIDVDHFIPWSYIFDDNAWNLVLACRDCNCKKSNSLAKDNFLNNLIERNEKYYERINKLRNSLDMLSTKNGWNTEIKNHYENCKKYGFNQISLP